MNRGNGVLFTFFVTLYYPWANPNKLLWWLCLFRQHIGEVQMGPIQFWTYLHPFWGGQKMLEKL